MSGVADTSSALLTPFLIAELHTAATVVGVGIFRVADVACVAAAPRFAAVALCATVQRRAWACVVAVADVDGLFVERTVGVGQIQCRVTLEPFFAVAMHATVDVCAVAAPGVARRGADEQLAVAASAFATCDGRTVRSVGGGRGIALPLTFVWGAHQQIALRCALIVTAHAPAADQIDQVRRWVTDEPIRARCPIGLVALHGTAAGDRRARVAWVAQL
jgi:hypothetical protein